MLFRFAALTVCLVFGGCKIVHTEIPPAPNQPQCLIKGWPPRWNILTLLSNDTSDVSYQAQYCHSSFQTRFCTKYELYKTVCTLNETNRIRASLFQCNMTEVLWSLYPNLVDPRLHPKVIGNSLCTIVRASNKNGTSYSKKKCCSARTENICKGIVNLQGTPSAKRELNITWETPADISDTWNQVLGYEIRYTGNSETRTTSFSSFTEHLRRPSRQHSVILKNLPPFTKYSIEVSCYYVSPSGIFDSQVYAQTLPEAPYSPPTITDVQTVSSNDTMKSVQLKWKHPPKNKTNGVISKSVLSYCIQSNLSSSPGYLPANGSNLTVHGLTSETVIEGLHIDYDYLVTVMSCTVECSKQSPVYQIKREQGPPPSAQASTGSSLSDVMVTVLSVVGVFLAIALLGICYVVYQRRKKRRFRDDVLRVPLPDDLQISLDTPDSDSIYHLESSDYACPAAVILTTPVEPSHERASMLQNENDGGDSEKRIPSTEEIPLHQPFLK